MVRRCLRWLRTRWKRVLVFSLLVLFVLVNVLAYLHARAMTHFVQGGNRTAIPEKLSVLQKCGVLLTGVTIPRPENQTSPESLGLSFETCRIPSTNGIELEAWHLPNSLARGLILLFHGYTACKADLLHEAKAFHNLGYATLLVDFRGSGGSTGNETSIGVYEADDVAAAVGDVRKRWPGRPLILYGFSMGSAAILRALAVHRTEATAVILEGPFDRLTSTVGNRFASMGLPTFPGAELLVFWGGVQQGFNGARHNPIEYAATVNTPVLVIHGDQDVRATKAQVEAVFDALQGPKHLELFHGTGHDPCLAANAKQWKRAVSEFLERHAQPAERNRP